MLKPLETGLVIGLAILGRYNSLIAREVAILVLIGEVIFARANNKRLDRLAFCINRLDNYNLFPVSRLH